MIATGTSIIKQNPTSNRKIISYHMLMYMYTYSALWGFYRANHRLPDVLRHSQIPGVARLQILTLGSWLPRYSPGGPLSKAALHMRYRYQLPASNLQPPSRNSRAIEVALLSISLETPTTTIPYYNFSSLATHSVRLITQPLHTPPLSRAVDDHRQSCCLFKYEQRQHLGFSCGATRRSSRGAPAAHSQLRRLLGTQAVAPAHRCPRRILQRRWQCTPAPSLLQRLHPKVC